MLFLLSIVLVVVALILLVLGFAVSSGLGLIYAAIIVAVAAGAVLVVSVLLDRKRPTSARERPADIGSGFEPATAAVDAGAYTASSVDAGSAEPTSQSAVALDDRPAYDAPAAQEPAVDDTVGVAATGELDDPAHEDWAPAAPEAAYVAGVEPGHDELATAAVPAAGAGGLAGEEEWVSDEDWAADDYFPIAEYNDLNVEEILPLLPQLYPEEIPVVEERERSTKNRAVILDTLADLREELAVSGGDSTGGQRSAAADEWEVHDEWEPTAAGSSGAGDLPFPIDDYDDLSAAEVIPLLGELEPDELEDVRVREARGANRATVLTAISRRLGRSGGAARPAASAPSKPPARKAAAKKSPVKRSAAKAAPAKKSAGAKKAPAARKAPASRTSATKAAPGKAPARKAAAKQTSAGKAASTRKAAAPAKKAAAKRSAAKATPAKKAAAKKSSAQKSAADKTAAKKASGGRAPRKR